MAYSAVAQWWSIRLLTEGLQVRVLPAEQEKSRHNVPGFCAFKPCVLPRNPLEDSKAAALIKGLAFSILG